MIWSKTAALPVPASSNNLLTLFVHYCSFLFTTFNRATMSHNATQCEVRSHSDLGNHKCRTMSAWKYVNDSSLFCCPPSSRAHTTTAAKHTSQITCTTSPQLLLKDFQNCTLLPAVTDQISQLAHTAKPLATVISQVLPKNTFSNEKKEKLSLTITSSVVLCSQSVASNSVSSGEPRANVSQR